MKCLIIGAGGHGRVVLDILTRAAEHEVVGFVDSDPELRGARIDAQPVLGQPADLPRIRDALEVPAAIVAIGQNQVRREITAQVRACGFNLVNAVHPSANLARNARIGDNVVIAAGALVCAHCRIEDSAILNTGCIVDHESCVGVAAHVCPGARLAGRVRVDDGAFVGIGATVIQNLRIGRDATVGAGAVVIHDVAARTTVVGVPAHPLAHDDRAAVFQRLVRAQPALTANR
jgi:sugar O-acyltransferase (sialic acid O-acetyltransferase NeuD family)